MTKRVVIKEGKKKDGEFEFEGYNPNGSIKSKGTYDSSGGRKGLWSFYSEYGVCKNVVTTLMMNPMVSKRDTTKMDLCTINPSTLKDSWMDFM